MCRPALQPRVGRRLGRASRADRSCLVLHFKLEGGRLFGIASNGHLGLIVGAGLNLQLGWQAPRMRTLYRVAGALIDFWR